jgi:hypothetical protein
MNLIEAMQSVDMDDVINRMNAYAISRLKTIGVKSFNGQEPIDFVGDLFLKIIEEKRNWNNAQCSFTEFLFGCLKSEISNFFVDYKDRYTEVIPEIINIDSYDIAEKQGQISDLLMNQGADDDELTVFEYWMDGIYKPAVIAADLGIDVKDVYKIIKRLERRLPKIQTQAKNLI